MVTEGEPENGAARHNARVIAGRYLVEARLGRGGMGVVWRATDQLLGRGVAVKELPFDETLSAAEARRQRDRTLREARALAQLSHPHIIVVHDVVEDEERPYIVLELIEGPSLADRIAEQGPVDAMEAARIGIDLLGALRAAHTAGVLHRDLKPANVLLENGTDRVVLTDFGIAQVAGSTTLTETGSFVGSPEYTAPERMSGARTGPESDLWSLGALLCTALSGESPFRRDSLGGVLHAVVVDEIRPPAQADPILPVVRGLLERDPDRRLDADRAEGMLRVFRETGRTPESVPLDLLPPDRDLPRRRPSARREEADGGLSVSPEERPVRRRPTKGTLVAAMAVAAMAGAGVSAAALLIQDRDGDGGGTPTSTAPETSASESPAGPGAPASTATATTPRRPLPSAAGSTATSPTATDSTATDSTATTSTATTSTATASTATTSTSTDSTAADSSAVPHSPRNGR
ncbi:serine/threonine protein kinase [Streptomyces griseoloalbus]|uniref:serine/threonine-protein kinase n=1 Tax=Streptomyces griseoloalbus TaxID=67303 RepID=UPI001873AE0C|nr:serine/threonine protein kinase [Streptomyces griseoloalbus]